MNLDPKAKKNIITKRAKKKTRTRNEAKKKRSKEEEKPKKFQFIHSLNKYNIRYGVFMYIIHFQRNAHSMNGLWCEKSLWGFQAPHGARCIDCTLFLERPNGLSVRANKWEPKKKAKTRRRAKRQENEESEWGGGRRRRSGVGVDSKNRKINSLSVRILLKANETREKAVHTDISMCLYLILCLSSERCYCRHPKSEPQTLLLIPNLARRLHSNSLGTAYWGEKEGKKNHLE